MKASIPYKLAVRSSRFFWRDNLAPTLCAAMVTGIFVCSLCLSASIINSMKRQVDNRLGRIEYCLSTTSTFRAQLASDIAIGQKRVNENNQINVDPPILVSALKFDAALITHIANSEDVNTPSASDIRSCVLWGVDERFSHLESPGKPDFKNPKPGDASKPGEATVSQSVAKMWNLKIGDGLILALERPQEIPLDSPLAKRSGIITQISVTVTNIVPDNTLASINLKASQHGAVNVFVDLNWLQQKMGLEDRANIILSDSEITYNFRPVLDDYGFQFKVSEEFWTVSSNRLVLSEQERAALMNRIDELYPDKKFALGNVMTALVNKATVIKDGVRKEDSPYVSYSFLAATDDVHVPLIKPGQVAITPWTAEELELKEGDLIEMEFYVPDPTIGKPVLKKREFEVRYILEDKALYYDSSWVPFIKGLSDKNSIQHWDISFSPDDKVINPEDEEYWDLYGPLPKFYISLDEARELFTTSGGAICSMRAWGLAPPKSSDLAPAPHEVGWTFIPLKKKLSFSAVSEYDFTIFFVCISLTIIIFSLVLTVLFMRLNMNYRCKDIGLLQTVGWDITPIRQTFIYENIIISVVGAALGIGVGLVLTALGSAYLNSFGLEIIGVPFIGVSLNIQDLIPGVLIGWLITFIVTIISIRNLGKVRSIHRLQGIFDFSRPYEPRPGSGFAHAALQLIFWLILIASALTPMAWNMNSMKNLESVKLIPRIIFIATTVALAMGIWSYHYKLRRVPTSTFSSDFCNCVRHPWRSFYIMATGALMIFLIPSLSLFMYRTDSNDSIAIHDNGGYCMVIKTTLPVFDNIDNPTDREAIGFTSEHQKILQDVDIDQAMLLDGDDASLGNLYYPCSPRIIGVSPRMMNNQFFAWKEAMIPSFPWEALWRKEFSFPLIQKEEFTQDKDYDARIVKTKMALRTRVLPFIIDVQTMKKRYHLKGLDSGLLLDFRPGREVQGRVVAVMDNDIFHGSLVTSDENLRRFFPETRGYRMFFVFCPSDYSQQNKSQQAQRMQQVRQALLEGLEAYGPEIETVFESQNRQMDVHNSWVRLTQVWLLVGFGLGCLCYYPILRRNLLRSQSELANLYTMGYSISQIRRIAILELIRPLSSGINTGTIAAIAAIVGATLLFKNTPLLAWMGIVWLTTAAVSMIISWIACSRAAKTITNESLSETLKKKA